MNISKLESLYCREIVRYKGIFQEQTVLVCDTETIKGKPYTIQFFDGLKAELFYVDENNILNVYLDYVQARMCQNLSVWFFYCQFDLPIIHYPYKSYFTLDNHQMGYGDFDFAYVTGKTWYGNHTYKGREWFERDAFQYVFRGLAKVAKDLHLTEQKLPRPSFLGERKWLTHTEQQCFERYAIADVLVLWELVYWILGLHRTYDVGLSVSLADLAGKIFRKHHVSDCIVPTTHEVTIAALASYHGGKTECYVQGPTIVENITEYDLTSAYPYAMTRIGNFFDYDMQPWEKGQPIFKNGVYQISANVGCGFKPLYTEEFKRTNLIREQWVTGWELESAINGGCLKEFSIVKGFAMISLQGKCNGLSDYVWSFFKKKQQADQDKNVTERLSAKLFLNALYGKFISRITEEVDLVETWRGGVIFHPLIATLITGFVRAYVHDIEHSCHSLHTSTDSFISFQTDVHERYRGIDGLGGLQKQYTGDALIVRPKVYVIFDKLKRDCYHKFVLDNEDVLCIYCRAKVLKAATHGFYGSIQMLLNMWKGGQTNYVVNRMIRLKEAKRSRDPEILPFVFTNQRRSLNVDWGQLTLYKG